MSDHCNCDEQTEFRVEEVACKINVKWYPHEIPASREYFVRQKYCTQDHAFVTITPNDFACACGKTPDDFAHVTKAYQIQDTVLAESSLGQKRLEPFVIVDFFQETRQVQLRQLLRVQEVEIGSTHAPNDLIWTDRLISIPAKNVKRKCHIRFALPNGHVPSLYLRGGQADLFKITHRLIRRNDEETIHALETPLPGPMIEGLDFSTRPENRPPMKLLSLFSGGGNFDRGLEEGGCICTKWAVEWNSFAAHSYRASRGETQIFLGSVDEFLARAMDGKTSKLIPQIGEVDCICGGSPCQGFSNMQPDTQSVQSMTNASKVASVAAYIDHYRPSYGLLENVVSMTRPLGPNKENVFSQLLCALVAMGYQVQQFNLDAWSFGDSQSRSRLFVAITAPGLLPMPHPRLTHSHPPGKGKRKLGKAVNGQSFGERRFDVTPFSFVTAKESTKDLPNIGDGHVLTCIPFPDHRQHTRQRALLRSIMKLIPTSPPGMNLSRTIKSSMYSISTPILDHFNRQHLLCRAVSSSSMCRIIGDSLFPTVVTKLALEDGKSGRGLHWSEPRTQTLMEARRAQGFLDNEPLIGFTSAQWKIVGNSVARSVSLALGMSLREAWLANSDYLVRRVTNLQTDTATEQPTSATKAVTCSQPVVLVTASASFDPAEYETYDDCKIDSRQWTAADASLSADEHLADLAKALPLESEDSMGGWRDLDDIIANVLDLLPADDVDRDSLAEAIAQKEVAIEPDSLLEIFNGVQGDVIDDRRPLKMARK